MAVEAHLGAAFLLAFVAALAATPLAIRVARRTAFYDHPAGYKAHLTPTPYLGGAAVLSAFALGALLFGDGHGRFGPVLVGALGLWVIGTIDDRRTVRPSYRLIASAAAGGLLWITGLGWSLFELEVVNLVFTVFWVVALVNAFNLMDNMDGTAGAVAAMSSAGIGVLAIIEDATPVAAVVLALCGACVGFLRYNLAAPARIFLGDGGSMPIGLVLAGTTMALWSDDTSQTRSLIASTLLVGLVVFDTGLVIISRKRRGAAIYRGGRDHVTHRLSAMLGSSRAVALVVGLIQALLCSLAALAATVGGIWPVIVGGSCLTLALASIGLLENERWWPWRPGLQGRLPPLVARRQLPRPDIVGQPHR